MTAARRPGTCTSRVTVPDRTIQNRSARPPSWKRRVPSSKLTSRANSIKRERQSAGSAALMRMGEGVLMNGLLIRVHIQFWRVGLPGVWALWAPAGTERPMPGRVGNGDAGEHTATPPRSHGRRVPTMENRPVGSAAVAPAGPTPRRRTEELGTEEAFRLLGTVGLGRTVFTRHALPAVRPLAISLTTATSSSAFRTARHWRPCSRPRTVRTSSWPTRSTPSTLIPVWAGAWWPPAMPAPSPTRPS